MKRELYVIDKAESIRIRSLKKTWHSNGPQLRERERLRENKRDSDTAMIMPRELRHSK